ncbi:MAG: hypothetical protein IKI64_06700 [Clostridia bacterium]|nr:hypothetical protein [Clostridia bacterium]
MKKHLLVPMLVLALILAVLPVFRSIAAEQAILLTIRFVSGETALSGARFDIYYVAQFGSAGYTLVPAFAEHFTIEGYEDHYGWDALAEQMSAFAEENGVAPTQSGETDSGGRVSFPGAGEPPLEEGLYLVVGHPVDSGGSTYTCLPFLVLLPSWDEESSSWVYSVTASPKSGSVTPQPTPSPVPSPTPTAEPSPTPTLSPSPTPDISPTPAPPETTTPNPTTPPSPPTGTASIALVGTAVILAALAIILLRRKEHS